MTSWSSGEVTLTISPSCTWSVRLQPTPQYGQTVSTSSCSSSRHVAGLAQLELARRHQRARRADGDAVAAVDAGRLGQRHVELGRDVRVEAAAGDGDRERVLVVDAAGLDALVTEDALRVVAHVEVVVDLHRLRDRERVGAEALGLARRTARCTRAPRARWRGRTDEPSSSSTSRRLVRTRSESVRTTMPSSALREQAGTSVRAPSSSTTQTRQTLTGVSVSP